MTDPDPGYYDGTIREGWATIDNDQMRINFIVDLESDTDPELFVTCTHSLEGDWGHLGREVMEHLELTYPDDAALLNKAKGKRVSVKVKHKEGRNGQTFVNAYIQTGKQARPEPAADDAVKAKIEELKIASNIPF